MSGLQKMKSAGCKMKNCQKHGEYEAQEKTVLGRVFYTSCPKCEEDYIEQQRLFEEAEEKRAWLGRLKCAGVLKRFIDANFKSYQPVCDKAAAALKAVYGYYEQFRSIMESGTCLVLCGRPGTGKTHLANALAKALIIQKYSVLYTTSFKMMARIKATYNKQSAAETETGVINDLTSRDLLIIDEVGVQFGSEAEKVLFYQVINGRYENVLPTVLISNLTAQELSDFIGERAFDRLKEASGAVLSFDWQSYRK